MTFSIVGADLRNGDWDVATQAWANTPSEVP